MMRSLLIDPTPAGGSFLYLRRNSPPPRTHTPLINSLLRITVRERLVGMIWTKTKAYTRLVKIATSRNQALSLSLFSRPVNLENKFLFQKKKKNQDLLSF